jgi:hypothetical protein
MTSRLSIIRDATPTFDLNDAYEVFVSHNSKTGYSVNAAIARTCRPTKGCSEYCYALAGRLTFPAALAAQARNAAFFAGAEKSVLRHEARRVARMVLKRQTFVRMFGVGDLQPGSTFFTTCLATDFPELSVWVSTRKLELARQLPLLPNLHVMLSMDATTTRDNVEATRWLIRQMGPQFFAAWVRRGPDDRPPRWVSVVFEEHHMAGRAPWKPEPRACPATIRGGAEHEKACEKCRFCFTAEKRAEGPPLAQIRRRT